MSSLITNLSEIVCHIGHCSLIESKFHHAPCFSYNVLKIVSKQEHFSVLYRKTTALQILTARTTSSQNDFPSRHYANVKAMSMSLKPMQTWDNLQLKSSWGRHCQLHQKPLSGSALHIFNPTPVDDSHFLIWKFDERSRPLVSGGTTGVGMHKHGFVSKRLETSEM